MTQTITFPQTEQRVIQNQLQLGYESVTGHNDRLFRAMDENGRFSFAILNHPRCRGNSREVWVVEAQILNPTDVDEGDTIYTLSKQPTDLFNDPEMVVKVDDSQDEITITTQHPPHSSRYQVVDGRLFKIEVAQEGFHGEPLKPLNEPIETAFIECLDQRFEERDINDGRFQTC